MDLTIACADVGSVVNGNFGWAFWNPPGALQEVKEHGSIEAFADEVVSRLRGGRKVALGFECPLFVPLRADTSLLTRARAGEGDRPWSAGAGCGSLTTGIVQTAWVLSRVRSALGEEPKVFLRWSEFMEQASGLFLWEAFVSRSSKSGTHHGDAGLAVAAFARALPNPDSTNLVVEESVFSLIGAALLRTGWSVPVSILSEPCLVIPA